MKVRAIRTGVTNSNIERNEAIGNIVSEEITTVIQKGLLPTRYKLSFATSEGETEEFESIKRIDSTFGIIDDIINGSGQFEEAYGGPLYQAVVNGKGDDLTGWITNAQISTNGEYFICDTSSALTFDRLVDIPSGDLYVELDGFRDNDDGSELIIQFYNDTTLIASFNINTANGLKTSVSKVKGIVNLSQNVNNIKIERNPVGTNVNIKNIKFLPLTNTPYANYTAQQLADMQLSYFEGKLDVKDIEVESVGANLFNKETVDRNKYLNFNGTNLPSSVFNGVSGLISITGDNITISGLTFVQLDGATGLAYYDVNETFISWIAYGSGTTGNGVYSIPSNAYYVKITVNLQDEDTAMLNEGTTAKPYAPYNNDSFQIPVGISAGKSQDRAFRSLSNYFLERKNKEDLSLFKLSNDFVQVDGAVGISTFKVNLQDELKYKVPLSNDDITNIELHIDIITKKDYYVASPLNDLLSQAIPYRIAISIDGDIYVTVPDTFVNVGSWILYIDNALEVSLRFEKEEATIETTVAEPVYGAGDNNFVYDKEAVATLLNTRLKTFKGEVRRNTDFGLPNFKNLDKDDLDIEIANIILSTAGVEEIKLFESSLNNRNYTARIIVVSNYGELEVTL